MLTRKKEKPVSRYYLTPHLAVTFRADALDNAIPLTCPKTGIISTINMPALPITLQYEHPLSALGNCRSVIRAAKQENKRLRHLLDRQTLAGIVLSYLQNLRLLGYEPGLSAVEKNLLLQAVGPILLEIGARFLNALSHSPYIEEHYKTNTRFPRFSIGWATKVSANSVAQNFLLYIKTLQRATNPEELEKDRMLSIPMSLIQERKETQAKVSPVQRLHVVTNVRQERKNLRVLKDAAKAIFEDIESFLNPAVAAMAKMFIKNMHYGLSEEHARLLASKLELEGLDDAKKLAGIIRKAISKHVADNIPSFTQEVSPKPVRSIKDILAAKKAAKNGVVSELAIPNPKQVSRLESLSDDEIEQEIIDDTLEEGDMVDYFDRLNTREEETPND